MSKYYPIHDAAAAGDIAQIQALLDKGEDINRKSRPARNTPLIMAASRGRLECCKFLLEQGADHSQVGLFGALSHTALQIAAINGNKDIVNLFLSKGIGPDEPGGSFTAFHYACINGKIDVSKILLGAGANINSMDIRGTTPLCSAIDESQNEIFYWLLEAGADINAQTEMNEYPTRSALDRACGKGDLEKVQALVGKGANVNAFCLWGTPLINAVKSQRADVAEYLLKNGAKLAYSVKEKTGHALEIAKKTGNQEMIDLLVKYDKQAEKKNPPDKT